MDWERSGWLVGAGLVLFLVLLRGRAFAAPPKPDLAAIASIRGELKDARSLLLPRLKKNPREAQALFVLSCVCLQEGDLSGARDAARRFAAAAPSAPEAAVLLALIEERARAQGGSWSASFLEAIRTAKIQATPTIFPALSTLGAIDKAAMQALEPADRLLVEYAISSYPPPDTLIQQSMELSKRKDLSVPVGLTTYLLLSSPPSPADSERAKAAAGVIHALAEAHPETAFLGLVALLEGTSKEAPFSSEEIARIKTEVADHGGLAGKSLSSIYEAFKEAVAKVDPAGAHEVAFSATMGPYPAAIPSLLLTGRARATAATGTAAQRAELAAALTQLGRSLVAGSCLTDLNLGRMYLALAAELSGDLSVGAEAAAAGNVFNEMRKRTDFLRFAAGWPIAPLQREFNDRKIDGELALFKELPATP